MTRARTQTAERGRAGPWRLESLAPEPSQPWREVDTFWHRADVAPTIEDLRPAEGTVFRVWRGAEAVGLGVARFDGHAVRVVRAPPMPASGQRRWPSWVEAWAGVDSDAVWMLSVCAEVPLDRVVIAACACARDVLPICGTSDAALAAIEAAEALTRTPRSAASWREVALPSSDGAKGAARAADAWPSDRGGYHALMAASRAAESAVRLAPPWAKGKEVADAASDGVWYAAMARAQDVGDPAPGGLAAQKRALAAYVGSCVSLGDVLVSILRTERRKTPRALL
jgi:hypothetical protein